MFPARSAILLFIACIWYGASFTSPPFCSPGNVTVVPTETIVILTVCPSVNNLAVAWTFPSAAVAANVVSEAFPKAYLSL